MRNTCTPWAVAVMAVALCAGCERRTIITDAGALDALDDDALGNGDSLSVGNAVDFTINNCATTSDPDAGVSAGCCQATAPATVTFIPITVGPVDRQLWQFGDETSSTLATPTHTYAIPNKYDVTLVIGGPAGSLSVTKRGCLEVLANRVGGSCDVDIQCATGATCICGSQDQCGSPFLRGICTDNCRDAPCPDALVCADLSLGGSATVEAPWRRPLCLAACTSSADCRPGMQCRDLPGRFPAGKWIKGCFAPFPLGVGSACRNPQGALDSPACVSGLCADLGALGQCTTNCANADCPRGTSCATMASGEKRCLVDCVVRDGCGDDPWLACQNAATDGTATFLLDPGANKSVCAPKACTADKDCSGGVCDRPDAGVGRCKRKTA